MSTGPGIVTVTQTYTVTSTASSEGPTSASPQLTNHDTGHNPPPPPDDTPPNIFPPVPPMPPFDQEFPYDPYFLPQDPPPFTLPPSNGSSFHAGEVMDPLTAIIAILVVTFMYWGFKNGGVAGLAQQYQASKISQAATSEDSSTAGDAKKPSSSSASKGSSSVKDKDETPGTVPSIPAVSPAAFISLLSFALLAAVIIQGPLGLKAAFSGNPSTEGSHPVSSLGITGLLELLSIKLPGTSTASHDNRPPWDASTIANRPSHLSQAAGQGSSSNKNGHDQWSWVFNSPGASSQEPNAPPSWNNKASYPLQDMPAALMADKLAFFGLPPLLQTFPICQNDPTLCSSLAQNMDQRQLANLLGVDAPTVGKLLGQATAVQPSPLPLVPNQGFLGSYQGLKDLETLFYPLLIGAIGLIVLFDYGT